MIVKPLGTITACFPHVDEETKSILHAVMDEAKDYNDFAERLSERVIRETSPPLLNYFAYYHAFNQQKFKLVRELEVKVTASDLAKPLILLTHPWGVIDWDDFQKLVALALKVAPNDWIACHIYMAWRMAIESIGVYPERLTDLEPLRILESKINSDEDFRFFLSPLHHLKAWEMSREGKIDEAKTWFDRALTIAKKHDRPEHVAALLIDKAHMIKNVNFAEALSLLKIHRKVSDELGLAFTHAMNDLILGDIAKARGEYEKAINHLEDLVRSLEHLGWDSLANFQKCHIARQYNQMLDGARALEITTDVLEGYQSPSPWFPYIQETWALINLDRLDEAAQSLDLTRNKAPRIGSDWAIGIIHFLDGLLHKKKSEFPSAKFELEQAHSIFGSFPSTNWTLIELTHIEIEMFSYGRNAAKADVSGPWMQALMEQVGQKELPGIAAQADLLKAKFRFKQGRSSEAKKLVKKVLKTSKTSGMNYLRKMTESLLPELLVS
jgi:tetratricopeptide (TPR) repeat protein